MSRFVLFVVLVILADAIGLGLYFWLSPNGSDSNSLDPPDVTSPLPPSASVLGIYSQAAVVSGGVPCAQVGKDILSKGGSAVDAAIATLLCDGVCVMQAMGVGGGFLMTIYNRTEQKVYSLNARETAPAAANKTMYVVNSTLSTFGPLASGVPGELKGYQEAHQKFGKLPWSDLFQPTIELCENGVPVSKRLAQQFLQVRDLLILSPTFVSTYLGSTEGNTLKEGDMIKLPLLANTLRQIAESPSKAELLYNGSLTAKFVSDIQAGGGIITEHDLNNYEVRWEQPANASLSGNLTLFSAPLPGSGLLVAFMLRLMDGFYQYAQTDLERSQIMIETFKHAYGRRTYLGDPYFVNASLLNEVIFNLSDQATIEKLRSKIHNNVTSEDVDYYGADYDLQDHGTNNVVVVDQDGNAVCATSTQNTLFGSKFVSLSTGILLNNQMDDFSTPGVPNTWGVYPSASNFIEPGKRPMSSMSPTIILDSTGDVRLVVGGAGGTTITTQTTAVTVRHLWDGKNIKEAIDERRFHHQLLPMQISYEYGVLEDTVKGWHSIGHKTVRRQDSDRCAVITAAARSGTNLTANSDWRRFGGVAGY